MAILYHNRLCPARGYGHNHALICLKVNAMIGLVDGSAKQTLFYAVGRMLLFRKEFRHGSVLERKTLPFS